jgi:hypothetical protein
MGGSLQTLAAVFAASLLISPARAAAGAAGRGPGACSRTRSWNGWRATGRCQVWCAAGPRRSPSTPSECSTTSSSGWTCATRPSCPRTKRRLYRARQRQRALRGALDRRVRRALVGDAGVRHAGGGRDPLRLRDGPFHTTFTLDARTGRWTLLMQERGANGTWREFARYELRPRPPG